jgi:hypothetical protein
VARCGSRSTLASSAPWSSSANIPTCSRATPAKGTEDGIDYAELATREQMRVEKLEEIMVDDWNKAGAWTR